MKIRTLSPLLHPVTRAPIPVGTELDVSEQDVFWFRRLGDGGAARVVDEAKPTDAPASPRAERPSTRKE